MLNLLILIQLPAAVASAVPAASVSLLAPADIAASVPLAERQFGVMVSDPNGVPLGVIEGSDAATVRLRVGNGKIQVPANALRKVAGQITLPVTSEQITSLMATSAAFQANLHPSPQPLAPPRGFSELPMTATPSVATTSVAIPTPLAIPVPPATPPQSPATQSPG